MVGYFGNTELLLRFQIELFSPNLLSVTDVHNLFKLEDWTPGIFQSVYYPLSQFIVVHRAKNDNLGYSFKFPRFSNPL